MVQPIGQFPTSHAPIGPWHSPFEPRLPPPIPRLKPNVFALLTRWCFRNAKVVLIFWAVIFAATAWGCWINYHAPNTVFLPFPMQLSKEIAGAKKFASLERLQVVTLTHEDPQALAVARDSLDRYRCPRGTCLMMSPARNLPSLPLAFGLQPQPQQQPDRNRYRKDGGLLVLPIFLGLMNDERPRVSV